MKILNCVRILLLVFFFAADLSPLIAGYVRGHYRKNGTYVRGHYRNSSGVKKARTTTRRYPSVSVGRRSTGIYGQGPRNFSRGMKSKKLQQQGGRCAHCGRSGGMKDMEADHITPYSKGGRTSWQNLQILCRPCNRSKGNRYSH